MISGLITIAGGILAASALIVARKPNAKELIDKLTPYQGWIGIVMFFWGIWAVLDCVRHVGLISHMPVFWTFWLVQGVADLLVGFLLGFGLISKYTLARSAAARERGQALRVQLARYQGALGVFAITMGALYIVWPYVM